MKLTYLEGAVIESLKANPNGLKTRQIGCPNTLRGVVSSLVKKGLVEVSKNGIVKVLETK